MKLVIVLSLLAAVASINATWFATSGPDLARREFDDSDLLVRDFAADRYKRDAIDGVAKLELRDNILSKRHPNSDDKKENKPANKLDKLYYGAWTKGLKTTNYLRSQTAQKAEKATKP